MNKLDSASIHSTISDRSVSPHSSHSQNLMKDEVIDEINESKNRNRMMRGHFGGMLPNDQICIADFSCALLKNGLLRQGRLYITVEFLAFHSFIGKTKEILHLSKIKRIIPKTVMMLPTGIRLETENFAWELSSFLFRDNCVRTIDSLRKAYLKKALEEIHAGYRRSTSSLASYQQPTENELSAGRISQNFEKSKMGKSEMHRDFGKGQTVIIFGIAFLVFADLLLLSYALTISVFI